MVINKSLLLKLGATIVLVGGLQIYGANAGNKSAVIELFTSQGCSSCPPADRLIEQLAKQPELLVLTLSVDYWDYLGWKDTFASPENTQRQRSYARIWHERSVYTPQVVINGKTHVVGSNRSAINEYIDMFQPLPVDVNLDVNEDSIKIQLEGNLPENTDSAKVYLAQIIRSESVQIARGENHGREITYTNIVRSLEEIGSWDGTPQSFTYPSSKIATEGTDSFAVLVQTEKLGHPGEILGGAIN